ncbi:MAG TPA: hydrogenase maturation protease [Bryobacteraceae bacterium]|jgi:hydrogenase maturation protease|nr:hydrogenase maturation protease [Bryobacteraceae bacterium]
MNILVAGIGNIFQGDDAFGCEVTRLLSTRTLPESVRVVDFGIRGLDLSYALMDKPDLTILVDAAPRGGPPGTVYTIEPTPGRSETPGDVALNAHAMDPANVFRMVQAMGGEMGRVLLVGCEPADLGGENGRMGLTAPVAGAVPVAADVVASLISKECQET